MEITDFELMRMDIMAKVSQTTNFYELAGELEKQLKRAKRQRDKKYYKR